jgi:hypothetical protein
MLVNVVPSLLANIPPTNGVHVLFKLIAATIKLNSVLLVPISRDSRDLSGPSILEALRKFRKFSLITANGRSHVLVAPDAQGTGTK